MMSLFSSFDIYNFKMNSLLFMMMMYMFFIKINKTSILKKFLNLYSSKISYFFNSITNKKTEKIIMMVAMAMIIMWTNLNLISILPYFFSLTSQMSVVASISLTVWVAMNLYVLKANFKSKISHLIPMGSPMPMTPLLLMIEITSNLIRPITISVRLVANILAGHLMMILLSNLALSQMFPSFMIYTILNTVEMGVALIQSYIFCTMTMIYYSEI